MNQCFAQTIHRFTTTTHYITSSSSSSSSRINRHRATTTTTRRTRNISISATSDDINIPEETDVVIIGGGLAGLAAALELTKRKKSFVLLEATDEFGGRARTEEIDGFLLDVGFAIYLSSYEECARVFDREELDLRKFYAGADVRYERKFYRVADPFRHVSDAIPSLLPEHKIGSTFDKILVGLVRFQTLLFRMDPLKRLGGETILERLEKFGFSDLMIDSFFRPFLGGIFFNPELTTDSRLFDFVMRSLALGENCLPAKGIGALATQLVSKLNKNTLFLNSKVEEIIENEDDDSSTLSVKLINGINKTVRAKKIILAVEGPECYRLLGTMSEKSDNNTGGVGTTCVYFSCDKPYNAKNAILYLDGELYARNNRKKTLVNNCCFPSVVSATYAPEGKHLCSASIIGVPEEQNDELLAEAVKTELSDWFGADVTKSFKMLKVYRIPFAQPTQTPKAKGSGINAFEQSCESGVMKNVYLAGDHRDAATFDGALISGRRCVEYIIKKP